MKQFLARLGPGLLYAGAAVGVSHLVQSTRAGAAYGLWMVVVVVLANVLKQPFFKAGPLYAAHSGKSLIDSFHRQGKGAMALFYLVTLSTMFAVQAVVTLITASVLAHIFHLNLPLWQISAALLTVCGLILLMGHYQWLNNIMKTVIILLAVTTLVTLIAALESYSSPTDPLKIFSFLDQSDVFFLIALVGWMPAPLDIALWHSEWTLADQKEGKERSIGRADFDFKVGYWGTTFLAAAFVALGALILRGRGIQLPDSGAAFAGEVIGMYTATIGEWAFIFISIAAFTTMFSTTLTVLDAYPRVMRKAMGLSFPKVKGLKQYKLWLLITILGALFVLIFQLENMKQLVDFATSISFLTAPILASMIYYAVHKLKKPIFSNFEKVLAWVGMVFLYLFSFYYLWEKYLNA
ncbi:MAG: divalent metal cation transporter [Vicingaceae bacterium]